MQSPTMPSTRPARREADGARSLECQRASQTRSARERQRDDAERRRDRDREPGVQEVVAVAEARRGRSRAGRVATDAMPASERAPRGTRCPLAPRYCLMYGRPTAAGGVERPTTPATAMSVRTYGSASKERRELACVEVLPAGGRRARSRSRRGAHAANGAERPPVAEDERRESDEAAPAGHVLGRSECDEADREIGAAERGKHAGRDDRRVADAVDRDPDRVGCARMLPHRSDPQADRRLEEDEVRR